MRNLLKGLNLIVIIAIVSCVTINIYFPAEELRGAADRIVEEVYGEGQDAAPAGEQQPGSSLYLPIGLTSVYAAQDINVTTPEIRALRSDMQARFDKLAPALDSGHVGITRNGYLTLRSTAGLDLKKRAEYSRLVNAENQDRKRLYQEIARANGFPDKTDEVESIFADSWRDKARQGWYIQDAQGNWTQK